MVALGLRCRRAALGALMLALLLPAAASAQASRTYVDRAAGSDVNDCLRGTPCQTFQRAHDQTAPRGEINVLTTGNYSSLVINRPITIDGNGHQATVSPFDAAVTVNAPPDAKVTLRDLSLNCGANLGTKGVSILQAGSVVVADTKIFGCSQDGIVSTVNHERARLLVKRSSIHDNAGAGVLMQPGSAGAIRATIRRSDVDDNGDGVVADSVSGGKVVGSILRSAITESGQSPVGTGLAVQSRGARSTLFVTGNEIQGNRVAFRASSGGQILSGGDNDVFNNVSAGAVTGTFGKM